MADAGSMFGEGCPGGAYFEFGGDAAIKVSLETGRAERRNGAISYPMFRPDGITEPDAIRVAYLDEYRSSYYQDNQLCFSDDAEAERLAFRDSQVPKDNIQLVQPETLDAMRSACQDCSNSDGVTRTCPALGVLLEALVVKTIGQPPEHFESAALPTWVK